MSAACPPNPSPEQSSGGHLRARGRGEDKKKQVGAPWRKTSISGDRVLTWPPEQQQTEPDGEPLLSPHVPDGAERMSE